MNNADYYNQSAMRKRRMQGFRQIVFTFFLLPGHKRMRKVMDKGVSKFINWGDAVEKPVAQSSQKSLPNR